jgi:hypothetical protein
MYRSFIFLLFTSTLLIASPRSFVVSNGWEVLNDTTVKNQIIFDNDDTIEMTSYCSKGKAWLVGEKVSDAYFNQEQKRYFECGVSKLVVKSKITKDTKAKVHHRTVHAIDIFIIFILGLAFIFLIFGACKWMIQL